MFILPVSFPCSLQRRENQKRGPCTPITYSGFEQHLRTVGLSGISYLELKRDGFLFVLAHFHLFLSKTNGDTAAQKCVIFLKLYLIGDFCLRGFCKLSLSTLNRQQAKRLHTPQHRSMWAWTLLCVLDVPLMQCLILQNCRSKRRQCVSKT